MTNIYIFLGQKFSFNLVSTEASSGDLWSPWSYTSILQVCVGVQFTGGIMHTFTRLSEGAWGTNISSTLPKPYNSLCELSPHHHSTERLCWPYWGKKTTLKSGSEGEKNVET